MVNVVERFSVSLNDSLAEWVETQAQQRGVSKAKVIRDAIAAARESQPASDRVDEIERRLELVEQRLDHLTQRQDASESHTPESSGLLDPARSGHEATTDPDPECGESEDNIVAALREYLSDRPPRTEHGTAAIVTTIQLLREQGPMSTQEIQEAVYQHHPEHYASARSLWQSIQRHFDQIPGINKAGYGRWEYAGDDTVWAHLK